MSSAVDRDRVEAVDTAFGDLAKYRAWSSGVVRRQVERADLQAGHCGEFFGMERLLVLDGELGDDVVGRRPWGIADAETRRS